MAGPTLPCDGVVHSIDSQIGVVHAVIHWWGAAHDGGLGDADLVQVLRVLKA